MNILTFFGLKDLLCVKTKRRECVIIREALFDPKPISFISFLII